MGKFTAVQTYSRFLSLWNENKINRNSLTFILDTGQLYTHGIFLNSVAYGTEANGAIDISIAGTSKSLSLSSHTHSNYLEKNKNIDIGTYKIVSGDKDLLYYNAGNTYLGNSTSPVYLVGTEGKIVKGSTTYTLLDTGNFSILSQTANGIILSNSALFKYGSKTFSIDYIKRYNSTSNFDSLNSVTSAGTTTVNGKKYGFMTFYEEGATSPSWSLIRIDVTDRKLEFRTSSNPNNWVSPAVASIPANTATVAGIVDAPGANNSGKVWKTDADGTPAWRNEVSNTWRNIRINDEENDSLTTGTGTGALYIKLGSGITVAWQGNKIVISNASPNIWKAANTNQEGYVPKSIANKILRTNADGTLYWGDDANTTYTFSNLLFLQTSGTNLMTYNSQAARTILAGSNITFTHNNNVLTIAAKDTTYGIATNSTAGLVKTGAAVTDVTGMTAVHIKDGVIYYKDTNTTYGVVSKTAAGLVPQLPNETTTTKYLRLDGTWVTPPDNNTWIAWKGATDSANGTAGYMPAPTSALRGQFLRGDGTWVSLNNYSLPTASNSTLGGVKTGAAITDTTGYTAVHIKDGIIYYKDTNTTYSFYNLLFQNSGGTTVDTYKPTTSPTKTLKAGSNVTISAASNVITIASTNTWNANAVGVAGYVAAPTKAANANMTWQTDAEGVPAWRASNNHSHAYLPLAGGTINSNCLIVAGACDSSGDAYSGGILLREYKYSNNNLEDNYKNGPGISFHWSGRWVHKLNMHSNALYWDNTRISLDGHTHAYTTLTGSGTTANQAIVSTGTANGWTLKTLGSRAFDNTSYLPLSGANYNTSTDTNPFTISRAGGTGEAILIMVNDSRTLFKYTNDEATSSIVFQLVNTDTENGGGASASDHNVTISSNKTGISLSVGGTLVSLNGHKHAYTDLTGSGTTANLAILSNGTANGWKLATLGARAFDSTNYLPLSGGIMNDRAVIARSNASVMWYQGRLYPIIKTTSYTGYNSILSMKTTNGSWDLGVYTNDTAYLTYITDANYNAGTNNTTYLLTFPKATGTIALTSLIPTVNNGTLSLLASGTTKTTFTANQSGNSTFNIAAGSGNGTISVGGADVAVKGLGGAAYLSTSDFVRAYGTTNDNIDSDWGQSIKTFDPIPSGTPPELNANITLLSLGNGWARRKMLAFTYNNDNIYYRRRVDSNFSNWVKILHSSNWSSYCAAVSHTHNMNDIKWPGSHNLITSATANGQEWSIDCTPGTYTGTYWLVWRATTSGVSTSGTMLKVDCDTGKVSAPYGFVGNLSGTATNADTVDNIHATGFLRWECMKSIGSSSPFLNSVDYFNNLSNLNNGGTLLYNPSGTEYTILFTRRNDSNSHGSILKWGYSDRYIRIIRMISGAAQSTDWEKISAGYADSAGSATNASNLTYNARMDYGWNGINYFNINAANLSAAKVNDTPFSSATWTHILRFNHANNNGYYTDLAIPFNANGIYYKRVGAGSLQNSGTNGGWISVLDNLNSSVSKSGETLTVKINGTSQSLTNTWRGILNNLTSTSTTDSLSAAQGKALNTRLSSVEGDYLTRTTNQTVSGVKTFNNGCWSIASNESNEITTEHFENGKYYNNANTAVVNSRWSIRNALKFRWYSDYWLIGNIRSGGSSTAGFGIAFRDNTNVRQIDCFRVTTGGAYIQGYTALHAGNSSISGNTIKINGTSLDMSWANISSKPCLLVSHARNNEAINANSWRTKECSYIEIRGTELSYSNLPMTGYNGFFNFWTPDGIICTQFLVGDSRLYYRFKQSGTASITSSWRQIWTDSYDGSGSGLDADLLDGYHASSFVKNVPGTATSVTSLNVGLTFIYATLTASATLGLSAAMSVGQVLTVLAFNNSSASITLTVPSAWKSLDGYSIIIGALKFGEISILCYASGSYMVSSKVQ